MMTVSPSRARALVIKLSDNRVVEFTNRVLHNYLKNNFGFLKQKRACLSIEFIKFELEIKFEPRLGPTSR